jgi:hypothetical protein
LPTIGPLPVTWQTLAMVHSWIESSGTTRSRRTVGAHRAWWIQQSLGL